MSVRFGSAILAVALLLAACSTGGGGGAFHPTSSLRPDVPVRVAHLPPDISSLVCSAAAAGKATLIEYVATSERRETRLLDTEDGYADTPVWVIEMRGSFTAMQRGPGGTAPHGTVATATYNRTTHTSIGSGIVNRFRDLHPLGPVGTLTC